MVTVPFESRLAFKSQQTCVTYLNVSFQKLISILELLHHQLPLSLESHQSLLPILIYRSTIEQHPTTQSSLNDHLISTVLYQHQGMQFDKH